MSAVEYDYWDLIERRNLRLIYRRMRRRRVLRRLRYLGRANPFQSLN